MIVEHIEGKNIAKITLCGLSTCPWCRKARQFLNSEGVQYDYIDVDLTAGPEREEVVKGVKKHSPRLSFPL